MRGASLDGFTYRGGGSFRAGRKEVVKNNAFKKKKMH